MSTCTSQTTAARLPVGGRPEEHDQRLMAVAFPNERRLNLGIPLWLDRLTSRKRQRRATFPCPRTRYRRLVAATVGAEVRESMLGTGEDRYSAGHFATTRSGCSLPWLAPFHSDSRPTPLPWCRIGQISPSSTTRHYNRRHFHVWPSSIETTTLLPLQSQIVPPVTSKATWPAATSRPGAQRVRPRVRLPLFSVSDCTVTPSQPS